MHSETAKLARHFAVAKAATNFAVPVILAVRGSKVPFNIHTIVKNTNNYNFGVCASSVENGMATLVIFSILRPYIAGICTNLRLATKKVKSIIQLFQVFVPLSFTPFSGGKSANINNVFSCGGRK
jgi:type III secretory pathway component EscT